MQAIVKDDVTTISQAIAERVGQQKFRVWFKNSTKFTLSDGYLKVGVPNLFIASWIESHFVNEIHMEGLDTATAYMSMSWSRYV